MDLAVIVPWWDHTELLEFWGRNLELLAADEVIFIDNGSDAEGRRALSRVAAGNPRLRLVRNETNRGYAAANNQAVALARSSRLLFMNNDVELLAPLPLEHWLALAGEGIAGPAASCGNALGMPYVEGWALCATRAAMDRLRGWSEDYGAGYWDDVDLCTRAWLKGLPVSPLPETANYLRHLKNVTGGDGRLNMQAVHDRNLVRFAQNFCRWRRAGVQAQKPDHPLGAIEMRHAEQTAQGFLQHAQPDAAQAVFDYLAALASGIPSAADRGNGSGASGQGAAIARSGAAPHFGINLIANFGSGVGLGVISRGIAGLLKSREIPFSIFDVPHAWGTPQSDAQFAEHLVAHPDALSHPINLYVLPTVFFVNFFENNPVFLARPRLHVANIWWEASRLPPQWTDMLSRFDGILAMSDFIADICRNSLAVTPTLYGEAPLGLPTNVRANRAEFGLPVDAVVFVASLDPNSDPERKNPEALIDAFRSAFPVADRQVRLVLRLNNAATTLGQAVAQRLLQLAAGDGRIGLLLEPMRYDQVLSLYACADIYLSLHRGEGLGLGMLESMALGKAVIATGWSGNLSFMNHSNSALLRYRLIPVAGSYDFFRPEMIGHDARWADPVLEDAVAWMRHLRHDRDARDALGARAKASAENYQQKAYGGGWLKELEDLWLAQRHLPAVIEKLSYPARQAAQLPCQPQSAR